MSTPVRAREPDLRALAGILSDHRDDMQARGGARAPQADEELGGVVAQVRRVPGDGGDARLVDERSAQPREPGPSRQAGHSDSHVLGADEPHRRDVRVMADVGAKGGDRGVVGLAGVRERELAHVPDRGRDRVAFERESFFPATAIASPAMRCTRTCAHRYAPPNE